jgi:tRNA(Arg) A34 adenosine deaminase TadA
MTKVEKFFQLAKQVAERGDKTVRRHYRLGAVGIRSDGTIVSSSNIPCRHTQSEAHAEARLVRKLNHGSEVFVVRILRCGALANARPCKNCQTAMMRRGVRRVYYSISDVEYGCLRL